MRIYRSRSASPIEFRCICPTYETMCEFHFTKLACGDQAFEEIFFCRAFIILTKDQSNQSCGIYHCDLGESTADICNPCRRDGRTRIRSEGKSSEIVPRGAVEFAVKEGYERADGGSDDVSPSHTQSWLDSKPTSMVAEGDGTEASWSSQSYPRESPRARDARQSEEWISRKLEAHCDPMIARLTSSMLANL